jgi:nucleotide sugar dehydrogenase
MGLPMAAVLADAGATVRGVDIDESVVSAVNDGQATVEEPGLDSLVSEFGGGELTATSDGKVAANAAEVHIVLVPTVLDDDMEPALGPVLDVAADIAAGVDEGDLVVLESTAPPGTTAGPFREAVEPEHLTAGRDFGVAHCPERTSSGRVIRDLTESYPKIVGGIDEDSTSAAASFYRVFNEPGVIEVSSATAAEAVKVFEGTFRDTNIALANELAKACEEWGLDSAEVFEAANSQPYCDLHTPGLGVGGHCIPVYPHFVIGRATETPVLEASRGVNDGMPAHAVGRLESALSDAGVPVTEAAVLVLGITYRPGVRETRYAPAVALIEQLNARAAKVYAHDPLLDHETIEAFGAVPVTDPIELDSLDGVVLATGHHEYETLDLDGLREQMRTPVLVDGRGFFHDADTTEFVYVAIGDGRSRPESE